MAQPFYEFAALHSHFIKTIKINSYQHSSYENKTIKRRRRTERRLKSQLDCNDYEDDRDKDC
jgi:hypothetical protein